MIPGPLETAVGVLDPWESFVGLWWQRCNGLGEVVITVRQEPRPEQPGFPWLASIFVTHSPGEELQEVWNTRDDCAEVACRSGDRAYVALAAKGHLGPFMESQGVERFEVSDKAYTWRTKPR